MQTEYLQLGPDLRRREPTWNSQSAIEKCDAPAISRQRWTGGFSDRQFARLEEVWGLFTSAILTLGWIAGSKEERALALLPYLAMGMNVVNIDYRVADVALAPAAVEDCRCALRQVLLYAREYGFDPRRIAVAGEATGGHLALMMGVLPPLSSARGAYDKVASFLREHGLLPAAMPTSSGR
jgi:hypothetical protein